MGEFNVVSKNDFDAQMEALISAVEEANDLSEVHTVDQNTGDGWYKGNVYVGGTGLADGKKLAKEEELYVGRQNCSPFPFVEYIPASTRFNVITDMPDMSVYTGTPGNYDLGNNFIWTLNPGTSYRIVRFKRLVMLSSPGSNDLYIGSISSTNTDLWTKVVTMRDRTGDECSPFPFVEYNPASTPFNVITDMPDMSVYTGPPGNYTLGNFAWTLRDGTSYRIIRFRRLVLISSPGTSELYIGSISSTNNDLWSKVVSDIEVDACRNADAVQVYTNFTFIPGKVYEPDGTLGAIPSGSNVCGTEKIPCEENTAYYCRLLNFSHSQTNVVFFDWDGRFVGKLSYSDFTVYQYQIPDGTEDASEDRYLEIKKFVTPENAHFFAFNYSMTEANKKFFSISTVPLFWIGFQQPDMTIHKNSPLLIKSDKVLAVTGPSGVMIDRTYKEAVGDRICGFQEYLLPYYKEVRSYGYSSGHYYTPGTEDNPSIYEYLTGVGDFTEVDFSDVDELLIIQSGSQMASADVGTAGGYDLNENVDTTTLVGSIRGVVKYVLGQNPKCKIYVASYYKYNNSMAAVSKVLQVHDQLKALCDALGLTYIDLWSNCPFNTSNYSDTNLIYTYDGGHANNEGNKAIADVLKKYLLP